MGAMKKSIEKRKGDGKDRISELPDDVLCHILSFLPSNEAIATCLLSTRWRFLWTMVPALDFKLTKPTTHVTVDKFLSLRTTQRITRFHFNCKINHRWPHYVEKWVSAAINEKVEELDIFLCRHCQESVLSVPTLFTCTTIVTLKLMCSIVPCFPSSVHLPSLKTLHIHVDQCDPFSGFKNLVYGSPALELFHLKQKWDFRHKEVKIIRNCRRIQLFERKETGDLVIQSDSDYDFIPYYLEDHLENVVKAKAYLTVYDTELCFPLVDYLVHSQVFETLRGLRNIEFLSLSDLRTQTHDNDKGVTLDDLPQFQNLVQLRLDLQDSDSIFREFPLKCPKLESVEFIITDDMNKRLLLLFLVRFILILLLLYCLWV